MKTSAVSVESHTTGAVPIVSSLETIVLSVSPSRVMAYPFPDTQTAPLQYSANASTSSTCTVYSNGSVHLLHNNNAPWIGDRGVSRPLCRRSRDFGTHSSL